MKTKTKALILALCAVLLVVTTVFATVAFLTSTAEVKNTFTFGKVAITLDEAKVTEYGVEITGEDRVNANVYKLIPGHRYVKDPIIHVDADSENCWLFVELDNGLVDIVDATTIENQMIANGWKTLDGNVYYHEVVAGGTNVPVFEYFKIKGDADVSKFGGTLAADGTVSGGETIDVIAYAVQADGFDTAEAAWTATFGK